MAVFPIKNLGELGVIADIAPTDLPPNAFTDAINARFVEGRVYKMGGNAPLSYVDEDKDLTPISFQSMPFDYYSGGNSFLVVGDNQKLRRLDSYSMTDISKRVPKLSQKRTAAVTVHSKLNRFTLDTYQTSLEKGTGTVKVTVNKIVPDNIRLKTFTWEVQNDAFITVVPSSDTLSADITAKNVVGRTSVIVRSVADKSITQEVIIDVVDSLQGIVMNKSASQMYNGGFDTLSVSFVPPSEPIRPVHWSVSTGNSALVTLTPYDSDSRYCKVQANGVGVVTIQATADGTTPFTATCVMEIRATTNAIRLSNTQLVMSQNTVNIVTADVLPTTSVNKEVTWSIDFPDVVTLEAHGNQATLTSKAIDGFAVLTCRSVEDPNIVARCTVQVAMSNYHPASPVEEVLYDFTNIDDIDGLAAQMNAAPDAIPPITKFELSMSKIEVDVQEAFTISAQIEPQELMMRDDIVYTWSVDQAGYLSKEITLDNGLTLLALKATDPARPVIVTCEVSFVTGYDYQASPDHTWYHSVISNCCVATTYAEIPQVKQYKSHYFEDLPGWGDQTVVDGQGNPAIVKYNWKCERVRAFNNRLFALNMRETNDSGVTTHFPLRLRWSNFANENEAPSLWDDFAYNRLTTSDQLAGQIGQVEALENGYAGYIDLADSNGNLIDMLPLRDYLFVYTEFETYVGSPTMNSYQPLMFKKLFNDSGILAPECVCEVEGQHFVVTQNDIILHNGTSKKSLAYQRVKDKIIREVSAVNPLATKVHLHSDKREVWILYVAAGSPQGSWACNKAAIWNYEFDTWSFCDIPCSYDIGLADPPTLEKGKRWSDLQDVDYLRALSEKIQWQKNATNFHKRVTLVASAMKGFYQVDYGNYNHFPIDIGDFSQGSRETPLVMKIERIGLDFDNATNDWNQKHIQTFRPEVTGKGTFTFVAGGSQYSNEYGHKHSEKDFTLGKDRLVCVRLNHPYVYYNIIDKGTYGNDKKTGLPIFNDCAINGLVIEYTIGGRR